MKIVIDMVEFERNLNVALQGIALDVQESLKSKLTKEHGVDTADLKSSIRGTVEENRSVTISMHEQGRWLEYGTPPHFPPVKALIGWVSRKWGGSKKEVERKAWLLAYAISRRGTRPFMFIRPTFNNEVVDIVRSNLKSAFK